MAVHCSVWIDRARWTEARWGPRGVGRTGSTCSLIGTATGVGNAAGCRETATWRPHGYRRDQAPRYRPAPATGWLSAWPARSLAARGLSGVQPGHQRRPRRRLRQRTSPPSCPGPRGSAAGTHYHRNLLTRVPKTAQPWVSTPGPDHLRAARPGLGPRPDHAQVVAALEAKLPRRGRPPGRGPVDDILALHRSVPREVWRAGVEQQPPRSASIKRCAARTDVVPRHASPAATPSSAVVGAVAGRAERRMDRIAAADMGLRKSSPPAGKPRHPAIGTAIIPSEAELTVGAISCLNGNRLRGRPFHTPSRRTVAPRPHQTRAAAQHSRLPPPVVVDP